MEWMPALQLGWLNGWLMLASFYAIFSILMRLFPKDIVRKLYDISGLSSRQIILSTASQPFVWASLVLSVLTPLKVGQPVFVIGIMVFVLGTVGMIVALLDFRATPVDQPVTGGLYRLSRNPQWVALVLVFLGTCIAIGSWVAMACFLVWTLFYHLRILAEERVCLARYGEPYRDYLNRVPRYFLFF